MHNKIFVFSLYLLMLGTPALLCLLAIPRLISGVGTERAYMVMTQAVLESNEPAAAYRQAGRELQNTDAADGDGLVNEAEMIARGAHASGAELARAKTLVINGLKKAPLNPRGWTLLCEIEAQSSFTKAARCMDTGFFIAPFDWFTARRRAVLAATLLPHLSHDVRDAAGRRVKSMWESDIWPDHRIKNAIVDIYEAPNGAALLQAGFENDKDELRDLNRYLIRKQMYANRGRGFK